MGAKKCSAFANWRVVNSHRWVQSCHESESGEGHVLARFFSSFAALNDRTNMAGKERNQVYDTSLIHNDRCHGVVSVDGWLRHHTDEYRGQKEHARCRRL